MKFGIWVIFDFEIFLLYLKTVIFLPSKQLILRYFCGFASSQAFFHLDINAFSCSEGHYSERIFCKEHCHVENTFRNIALISCENNKMCIKHKSYRIFIAVHKIFCLHHFEVCSSTVYVCLHFCIAHFQDFVILHT
jgi:hypothetical protein